VTEVVSSPVFNDRQSIETSEPTPQESPAVSNHVAEPNVPNHTVEEKQEIAEEAEPIGATEEGR
jgi:hypothetical protein